MLNMLMANVNIAFPKTPIVNNDFTYADLHLDLNFTKLVTDEVAKTPQQLDLQVDYDLGAIRNSIVNLFLTSPGDKLLNPEFGMDLRDFIFYPTSDTVAALISDTIKRNITTYEPRIVLNSVQVVSDYDNQIYNISMDIGVPYLRVNQFILKSYLNSQGYVVFA